MSIGFIAGATLFVGGDYLIDRYGGHFRKRGHGMRHAARKGASGSDQLAGSGSAILLGALLDGIPESAAIGVGLAAGKGVGLIMLVAVFLSNLPEGISGALGMKAVRPVARLRHGGLGRDDRNVRHSCSAGLYLPGPCVRRHGRRDAVSGSRGYPGDDCRHDDAGSIRGRRPIRGARHRGRLLTGLRCQSLSRIAACKHSRVIVCRQSSAASLYSLCGWTLFAYFFTHWPASFCIDHPACDCPLQLFAKLFCIWGKASGPNLFALMISR